MGLESFTAQYNRERDQGDSLWADGNQFACPLDCRDVTTGDLDIDGLGPSGKECYHRSEPKENEVCWCGFKVWKNGESVVVEVV